MYKLKLPNGKGGFFNIELKELDEVTFIAVSSLVKSGKDIEATKLLLSELHSGGDNKEEVIACFPAVHSAMSAALQLLTPLESELKKK